MPDVKNITLSSLFQSDFSNTLRLHQDKVCTVQDSLTGEVIKATVVYKLYQDFAANSEFMGFYIPHSTESYALATVFLKFYKDAANDIKSSIITKAKSPGDSSATDAANLSFSGRVYIYHEDDFSLQQKAELEALYKEHGLSVIFRGHDYRMLHMWKPSNSNNKNQNEQKSGNLTESPSIERGLDELIEIREKLTHDIMVQIGKTDLSDETYSYFYNAFHKLHRQAIDCAKYNGFPRSVSASFYPLTPKMSRYKVNNGFEQIRAMCEILNDEIWKCIEKYGNTTPGQNNSDSNVPEETNRWDAICDIINSKIKDIKDLPEGHKDKTNFLHTKNVNIAKKGDINKTAVLKEVYENLPKKLKGGLKSYDTFYAGYKRIGAKINW